MLVPHRKRYCCDANDRHDLESYYINQAGSGGVFVGGRGQLGHGIGSFFSGLFRQAAPYLKRIGGQVLKSGARVASDMLGGKSFSESARARAQEGINEYLDEPGVSQQSGSGLRRFFKRKRSKSSKSHGRNASKKKKRSRSTHKSHKRGDIFT